MTRCAVVGKESTLVWCDVAQRTGVNAVCFIPFAPQQPFGNSLLINEDIMLFTH